MGKRRGPGSETPMLVGKEGLFCVARVQFGENLSKGGQGSDVSTGFLRYLLL